MLILILIYEYIFYISSFNRFTYINLIEWNNYDKIQKKVICNFKDFTKDDHGEIFTMDLS